tara:strand:- start:321 stop:506 length:186 start_codon:yes stop_codon:yes gene_type:complete
LVIIADTILPVLNIQKCVFRNMGFFTDFIILLKGLLAVTHGEIVVMILFPNNINIFEKNYK